MVRQKELPSVDIPASAAGAVLVGEVLEGALDRPVGHLRNHIGHHHNEDAHDKHIDEDFKGNIYMDWMLPSDYSILSTTSHWKACFKHPNANVVVSLFNYYLLSIIYIDLNSHINTLFLLLIKQLLYSSLGPKLQIIINAENY